MFTIYNNSTWRNSTWRSHNRRMKIKTICDKFSILINRSRHVLMVNYVKVLNNSQHFKVCICFGKKYRATQNRKIKCSKSLGLPTVEMKSNVEIVRKVCFVIVSTKWFSLETVEDEREEPYAMKSVDHVELIKLINPKIVYYVYEVHLVTDRWIGEGGE